MCFSYRVGQGPVALRGYHKLGPCFLVNQSVVISEFEGKKDAIDFGCRPLALTLALGSGL